MGGLLPMLVAIWRLAQASPLDAPIPEIGGLAILAAAIAPVVGAIASRGFEAHNILAALYHGATAPLTFDGERSAPMIERDLKGFKEPGLSE